MKRSWLEVDRPKTGRTERFCLDGFHEVLIGRSPEATLQTQLRAVPHQVMLTRMGARWQLTPLSSADTVAMNKMPIRTARWLASGDVFSISPAEPFRFLEEPLDPRWEASAARLAESDDSDEAWLVFSDALQELGDETGKQMLCAGEDPALPLGFLDRMRTDGTVGFGCRFGFIRTLTLRNVGLLVDSKPRVIEAVLRQPLARLMRVLEVDVPSFEDVPLEVLAKHLVEAAPPSLRVVRLLGVIGAPPRQLFPASLQVEWAPI